MATVYRQYIHCHYVESVILVLSYQIHPSGPPKALGLDAWQREYVNQNQISLMISL